MKGTSLSAGLGCGVLPGGVLSWAVFLAGCAVGPQFHRPTAPRDAGYAPTPLPQDSASTNIHGGEAQHLALGGDLSFEWWRAFGSPALDALVERAFTANPTLPGARWG